jgi:membrane protease YdiL (CAAX protease family)
MSGLDCSEQAAVPWYQNPLGIAITGTLGALMGLLVRASGRNLWPVIVGHGLFDASRFVLFYFQGPPMG